MKKRGQKICGVVLIGALLIFVGVSASAAEKFPTRTISIIVPWKAGGGGTINAQSLQPNLEKALGVGVQIINKPGGGGTIGWNFAVNSPPDGYTVAIINPSTLITQYTMKSGVNYRKFDPFIYTVGVPAGVLVAEGSPWKTFRDFIDYAKSNPEKIQMANSGYGATYHIGILGIQMATGVKFNNIPFKGSAPCITAVLGGHADASLIEISTLLPYVEAKKLRILAITSPERNPVIPDVPTFKEHGFELDVGTWYGYAVPKGTAKDRIQILHDAFKQAMEDKGYRSFYKKKGGMVKYMGAADFAEFLDKSDKLWKKIFDFSGFKPQK